jgi:hypothetical protein
MGREPRVGGERERERDGVFGRLRWSLSCEDPEKHTQLIWLKDCPNRVCSELYKRHCGRLARPSQKYWRMESLEIVATRYLSEWILWPFGILEYSLLCVIEAPTKEKLIPWSDLDFESIMVMQLLMSNLKKLYFYSTINDNIN